jgi:N-methylhydantoinase A
VRALGAQGIEALAVCFLFSFRNARHEQRAGEIARDLLPGCFVTISNEIFPQYREYERASTTVVNAYLGPRVSTYLERMSATLAAAGIAVPLHMMQSNGGIIAWTEATRMPCRIVESGPAAGVIAAAHFGKLLGRKNLISFDMGGTTAKAGLIENGEVRQSSGQELGTGINISRILQGGGYYVGAATVDLAEVGAGGGSIAWVDEGNVLKVGPQSAGADPGPVAYGLGGENVTVTDANLLLGRIPAEDFLGGEMRMDLERARRTVEAKIAQPLGITLDDACSAVVEVANASMLKMLRIVTVEKGCDPADFTMVAFGGNGPLHGPELAHDLGIREVIVPPAAGVLSAQGLLVADIRYDFRQTHVVPVLEGDLAEVENVYVALEAQGRAALRRYGVDPQGVVFQRSADMRYRRQAYEINVRLPAAALSAGDAPRIAEAFHEMHERLYGRRDPAGVVQLVTLCVTAIGSSRHLDYRPLARGDGSARQARKGTRKVFFREPGIVECPLYERAELLAADKIAGPAVIEADDSTVLVLPQWTACCDELANLILTRERSSQ